MKTRTYRRLKSRYPTARAAWSDIKKSIKRDYRGIKAGPHTKRYWVFQVTCWGAEVASFAYSYEPEDDSIFIIPLDKEGDPLYEGANGLVVPASLLTEFTDRLQQDSKDILDVRRTVRKGRKRNVSPDVVKSRYQAQVIADDVDELLRRQSRQEESDG